MAHKSKTKKSRKKNPPMLPQYTTTAGDNTLDPAYNFGPADRGGEYQDPYAQNDADSVTLNTPAKAYGPQPQAIPFTASLNPFAAPKKPASKKGKTKSEHLGVVTRSHKGAPKSEKYETCVHRSGTSRKSKTCATGPTIACSRNRALEKFSHKRKGKCR